MKIAPLFFRLSTTCLLCTTSCLTYTGLPYFSRASSTASMAMSTPAQNPLLLARITFSIAMVVKLRTMSALKRLRLKTCLPYCQNGACNCIVGIHWRLTLPVCHRSEMQDCLKQEDWNSLQACLRRLKKDILHKGVHEQTRGPGRAWLSKPNGRNGFLFSHLHSGCLWSQARGILAFHPCSDSVVVSGICLLRETEEFLPCLLRSLCREHPSPYCCAAMTLWSTAMFS